ncbi:MAG: cyclic nucleotide-binding domain-containing protein [Thermoplasmata archaeon]
MAGDDQKAITAGLRKSALLSGLKDRQLKLLARHAQVRHIAKDTLVVKRGEKGIGFYVILDGRVQVRKGSTVLARLGPGDYFGELALFDNRARSADVVATEPTSVVVLSRWEFWGFASEKPEILRIILQEMARRLAETSQVQAT